MKAGEAKALSCAVAWAMIVGVCSAESFDLDFAHGVPTGGVLRSGARVTGEGLVAADVTNRLAAGGFQFDHAVEYPEAFRLEADLVADGQPVHALLPVEVRVYDASGAELDGAGCLAAEEGVAKASVLRNLDDAPGACRVVCRDRASGLTVERTVRFSR